MNPDAQACDRCRKRKTKCDKIRPCCGPCAKSKASCVYADKSNKVVYRRDFVERLERTNRQLEARNRALMQRLSSSREIRSETSTDTLSKTPSESATQIDAPGNDVANEVSY